MGIFEQMVKIIVINFYNSFSLILVSRGKLLLKAKKRQIRISGQKVRRGTMNEKSYKDCNHISHSQVMQGKTEIGLQVKILISKM